MIKVGLLNIDQKDLLVGQIYDNGGTFFNPVQDNNNNWILSPQEIELCDNPEFEWVKELPLIEWEEPIEKNAKV